MFVDPVLEHIQGYVLDDAAFDAWKTLFKFSLEQFESQLSTDIESLSI
jgi:hypothetical protein